MAAARRRGRRRQQDGEASSRRSRRHRSRGGRDRDAAPSGGRSGCCAARWLSGIGAVHGPLRPRGSRVEARGRAHQAAAGRRCNNWPSPLRSATYRVSTRPGPSSARPARARCCRWARGSSPIRPALHLSMCLVAAVTHHRRPRADLDTQRARPSERVPAGYAANSRAGASTQTSPRPGQEPVPGQEPGGHRRRGVAIGRRTFRPAGGAVVAIHGAPSCEPGAPGHPPPPAPAPGSPSSSQSRRLRPPV